MLTVNFQPNIFFMTKEERIERAKTLHKQGCNCCQSVVLAFDDKLPIRPEIAMNMSAPFGRGLAGCREVCGCVSGMAMVCGLTGHTADVRSLIEKYRGIEGDIVCGRLLAQGKKPCTEMVGDAAGLISDII